MLHWRKHRNRAQRMKKESRAAGSEKQIPAAEQIREIVYWYASDYGDVFLADRILEQIDPSFSFAADLIETADLDSDEYLYRFGEYISKNELGTAHHLKIFRRRLYRRWQMSIQKVTGSDLLIPERICQKEGRKYPLQPWI